MKSRTIVAIFVLLLGRHFLVVHPLLRLNNGKKPHSRYGILEYSLDKENWNSLCNEDWPDINSFLACRELGFGYFQRLPNFSRLRGFKFSPKDNRQIVCNEKDSTLTECLARNQSARVECEKQSAPLFLVCQAGNPTLVKLISQRDSDGGILAYKEEGGFFLADGRWWTDQHDHVLALHLGKERCQHDLYASVQPSKCIQFDCSPSARSLDDCKRLHSLSRLAARLNCHLRFDLELSSDYRLEYSENSLVPSNFSVGTVFPAPVDIGYNVVYGNIDAYCEGLTVVTNRGRGQDHFKGDDQEREFRLFGVTSFHVLYENRCKAIVPKRSTFNLDYWTCLSRPGTQNPSVARGLRYLLPLFLLCTLLLFCRRHKKSICLRLKVFPRYRP